MRKFDSVARFTEPSDAADSLGPLGLRVDYAKLIGFEFGGMCSSLCHAIEMLRAHSEAQGAQTAVLRLESLVRLCEDLKSYTSEAIGISLGEDLATRIPHTS